jgi:RNA polymerase sigma factor (sigma-70 family)
MYSFSQNDIYFYKDVENKLDLADVKQKEFQLLEHQILDKYSDESYWFKIPAYKTNSKYIFRVLYERINNAQVYQNKKKIEKLTNQRYLSYKISRDFDVFIKIKPKLHSYIPIEFTTEEKSFLNEKNNLLLNGFYYGFTLLVIIYNIFYFLLFRDDAFLYYSLFLTSVSFGIFTMDGMLNYYNVIGFTNDFLMILNYIFLAFFTSKFVNSYLFLDMYFPKLERFSYLLVISIILLGILYLSSNNYYFLLFVNILVFALLFSYWLSAVLLFHKNMYTKILAIGYVILLFSAIDFFVLKFLGISLINTNNITIKIGAFLEMIILSIAVLYRMKILREQNEFMRNEIIKYANEVAKLTIPKNKIDKLSLREREVFDLIVFGKTNKEIADEVNVSVNTVKFHLKNIYEKLNIKSRKEAIKIDKAIKQ